MAQKNAEVLLLQRQLQAAASPQFSPRSQQTDASPNSLGDAMEMTLESWLAGLQLDRYAQAIRERGYDALHFFRVAEADDIDELAAEVEMKKPHAKALVVGWKQLVAKESKVLQAVVPRTPDAAAPEEELYDVVFSCTPHSESLCAALRQQLVSAGAKVWLHDAATRLESSQDRFALWFSAASSARKVVCFVSAGYLRSETCATNGLPRRRQGIVHLFRHN